MPNLNVAVLGPHGYAKNIGKAGTESDITFYNLKKGEDTVTIIEPSRYPERVAPLYYAVAMSQSAILVVDAITPEFGECVVMLDCAGIKSGYVILRNYIDKSQIDPLIKGTVIENYTFMEDDSIVLRESLLAAASKVERVVSDIPGTVMVDHHFNVKGIGTVILGGVVKGTIRTHDSVRVLPGERTAQIRSIQRHDDDCTDAVPYDRVGLALKNITADEIDRGQVVTTDDSIKTGDSFKGRIKVVKYWNTPMKDSMVIHIGHWMSYVSGKIDSVTDGSDPKNPEVQISLEKEIAYFPGDKAIVHHLDAGKLRVVGTIVLE
ncbi:elongation factor Tu domain 2 protein [Methanolacinia petrolearia DSM 11571]|uniref:Elongation factor Tu domain 2 protein n=1 Tax=Methanolacinia petrolearia (strain DSM 11571 / OCM 486 / SEBR 4847) TaxID=679926 RepID=E1RIV1_METP4|nr:EF-Tu/IF-2/RF-3 family GTPase [Methanolacinia petrolearia]ADN35539.1 elongation factor Tu domain 2 protein [Methanolacinia petrolearia DSM 11571]